MTLSDDQLRKLAKGLGLTSVSCAPTGLFILNGAESSRPVWSPSDLLLAILRRVTELDYVYQLERGLVCTFRVWGGEVYVLKYADDELEAAILAFIQLPECNEGSNLPEGNNG